MSNEETNKMTPTGGELLTWLGLGVVLAGSPAAAATIPAAIVGCGVVYGVRRSEKAHRFAETTMPLLSGLLVTGEVPSLPAAGDTESAKLARRQSKVPPKSGGSLFSKLAGAVLTDEEREMYFGKGKVQNTHSKDDGVIEAEVVEKRDARKRSETPAKPKDDGLVDDDPPEEAPAQAARERPRMSQEQAIKAMPKIVLLADLQPYPPSTLAVPMGKNHQGDDIWGDFGVDLLHVGVYGTSGSGKDQLLRVWFALLCKRNKPEVVKFVFLDGKGDWLTPDLAELKHMWREPAGGYGKKGRAAILTAIKAIDKEAEERQEMITSAGCRTLEQFNKKHPDRARPLLFVVASDMGDLGGEVEEIFTSLTQKARSLGFRIIASMQSPTGKAMDWRLNLSSLMAGSMVDSSQDGPALGVRETTQLPFKPSKIPPPPLVQGVFVARFRGEVMLVRTPMFRADKEENEARFDLVVSNLPSKRQKPVREAGPPPEGRSAPSGATRPMQVDEEAALLAQLIGLSPATAADHAETVSSVSGGTVRYPASSSADISAETAAQYAVYLKAVQVLGMPNTDVVPPEYLPMDAEARGIRKLLTLDGSKNAVARRLGGSKTTAYNRINKAMGLRSE